MSLLKNRYYLYLAFASALIVGGYLCTVSVLWTMVYCFAAPMLLGHLLRQYLDDHDFADEIGHDGVDHEW